MITSLILPETFKSTSVILPETDKNKLAGLGGLSDLATLAGVGSGEMSSVKLFPVILKSETVLKNVILRKYKTLKYSDSVNLLEYWDIRAKTPQLSYELTLKTLRDGLDVSMDNKSSIITLVLESEEPQLTADIINALTIELDRFMRIKRTTNANKQRQWIEERLYKVKEDLEKSENMLRGFRERNRIVSSSPQLLLEQERLQRDVQINGSLFAELRKQFELIKIEEIKNTPIVNVMDYAVPAAKKEHPKRSTIVLVSFFLAFLCSTSYVILKPIYKKSIEEFIRKITK